MCGKGIPVRKHEFGVGSRTHGETEFSSTEVEKNAEIGDERRKRGIAHQSFDKLIRERSIGEVSIEKTT